MSLKICGFWLKKHPPGSVFFKRKIPAFQQLVFLTLAAFPPVPTSSPLPAGRAPWSGSGNDFDDRREGRKFGYCFAGMPLT